MESAPVVLVDYTCDNVLEHLIELSQFFDDSVDDLSGPIINLFFRELNLFLCLDISKDLFEGLGKSLLTLFPISST